MSTSIRFTRLVAPLVAVAVVAGIAVLATDVVGQTSSACRAKNHAVAKLRDVDGKKKGRVVFGVHRSCKTKVAANLRGVPQGFHGLHVHTTGICDAESGFAAAGSHWNMTSEDHGSHTGDMPPVMVMDTGVARSRFLTDRFQVRDLFGGDGSAVILHAGPDNLAHIPALTSENDERYHSHAHDTLGADQDSRATGDAGSRFACGVVQRKGK